MHPWRGLPGSFLVPGLPTLAITLAITTYEHSFEFRLPAPSPSKPADEKPSSTSPILPNPAPPPLPYLPSPAVAPSPHLLTPLLASAGHRPLRTDHCRPDMHTDAFVQWRRRRPIDRAASLLPDEWVGCLRGPCLGRYSSNFLGWFPSPNGTETLRRWNQGRHATGRTTCSRDCTRLSRTRTLTNLQARRLGSPKKPRATPRPVRGGSLATLQQSQIYDVIVSRRSSAEDSSRQTTTDSSEHHTQA
ncbi:hypothetical protein RJ55_07670 [Drechmeria coniospora]|nr:hypothetical protein RJ55_07670 [Drechmeria coniospora]